MDSSDQCQLGRLVAKEISVLLSRSSLFAKCMTFNKVFILVPSYTSCLV